MSRTRNTKRDIKIYKLIREKGLSIRETARVVGLQKSSIFNAIRRVENEPESYPQAHRK